MSDMDQLMALFNKRGNELCRHCEEDTYVIESFISFYDNLGGVFGYTFSSNPGSEWEYYWLSRFENPKDGFDKLVMWLGLIEEGLYD